MGLASLHNVCAKTWEVIYTFWDMCLSLSDAYASASRSLHMHCARILCIQKPMGSFLGVKWLITKRVNLILFLLKIMKWVICAECPRLCAERCKKHSRLRQCKRVCVTCCTRCKCVPPGTYGNREMCGKCYTDMTTHGNRPKCP